jgi:hypothetical protein
MGCAMIDDNLLAYDLPMVVRKKTAAVFDSD